MIEGMVDATTLPNFLAAFMWRRYLNSVVLATVTHKGFGRCLMGQVLK